MRLNNFCIVIFTVLTFTCASHHADGAEIEGIYFDATYVAKGIRLNIQGMGVLRPFFHVAGEIPLKPIV